MKQILVVDDNISILKQISAHLAGSYEISLAKSGELALQICAREKPDLILLDIEMPGMDGFEVMSRLKQNPMMDRIPVIFLTASRDAETEVRGLGAGARDFIAKPVEKSILLHRIELHLRFAAHETRLEQAVTVMTDSIAASFAELIECRNENAAGHVLRTSKTVEALGQELMRMNVFPDELNEAELRLIVRAAPLHDIGKLTISDRILLKVGHLDDEEFAVMKRHAEVGSKILERMYQRVPTQHCLRYASLIAETHHERYDGKGYPWGLSGSDIPLCGRIMAVADVYDALIDDRVYRRGISCLEAGNIIDKGKGNHFDPHIVDAFNNVREDLTASVL